MKKRFVKIVSIIAILTTLAIPVFGLEMTNLEAAMAPAGIVVDGALSVDSKTGEFIWPEADGIDNGYEGNLEVAINNAIDGTLPIDSKTGEFIWPEADGVDIGQDMIQPYAADYNYASSSFYTGAYLKSGDLFNIQNTPKFTSVKQSTTSDGSCSVAYQIINNSTGKLTSKVLTGAWVNTSTSVSGFTTSIATGECKIYLAGQDTTVEKKASGTFNY